MNPRTVAELRERGLDTEVVTGSSLVIVTSEEGSRTLLAGAPVSEPGEPPEVYAPCRRPAGHPLRVLGGQTLLMFRNALWYRLDGSFDPDDLESVLGAIDRAQAPAVVLDNGPDLAPDSASGDASDGAPNLIVVSDPPTAPEAGFPAAVWLCLPGGEEIRPVALLGGEKLLTVQRTAFRGSSGEPLRGRVVLGLRDLRREEFAPRGVELEIDGPEEP